MCCLYRLHNGEQDEVAAGAARNNVLQRMKLNNKVALITGEALPLLSPYSPLLLVQANLPPDQPLCACSDAFSTSASPAANASLLAADSGCMQDTACVISQETDQLHEDQTTTAELVKLPAWAHVRRPLRLRIAPQSDMQLQRQV